MCREMLLLPGFVFLHVDRNIDDCFCKPWGDHYRKPKCFTLHIKHKPITTNANVVQTNTWLANQLVCIQIKVLEKSELFTA